MLKKITLLFIAIVLMMNMYIGVIYAAENKTENQTTKQNTVADTNTTASETEEKTEPEESAPEPVSKVSEAKAEVIEAGEVKKVENGSVEDTVQTLKLKVLDGDYKGKEFTTDFVLSYDVEGKILAYNLEEGNKVTVQITEDPDGTTTATVSDFQRANYIYGAFVFLLIAIIAVGGKQGIKAAISLVITLLIFNFVLIKSIFAGMNCIFASMISCMLIVSTTSLITIGLNKKALTAMVGSFLGTIFAGIIASMFGSLTKLSGASEEAIQLSLNLKTITFDFRQLIFAAILISSIGACMDIAVSIVNNIDESRSKTEDLSFIDLFKSGMVEGREVIGTMSNTLILVYLGGLIKLTLLYLACNMEISHILSKENFSENMVAAIAGSIGVVLTVPLTAIAYAIINQRKTIYKTVSDNKIEGKRSLKI